MFDPDFHNALVSMKRDNSSYIDDDRRWNCVVIIRKDGVQIEVIEYAPTRDEAYALAMEKMYDLCPKKMLAPMIEHRPVAIKQAVKEFTDHDDIPF